MKTHTQKHNFSVLLHDIRSVQNVASIFRLCEVLGAKEIILSGVTPGPIDRFGFERKDFTKISLGAEKSVKWKRVENVTEFIKDFQTPPNLPLDKGRNVVLALEQSENSVDFKRVEIDEFKNYLIIPGREVEGLEDEILNLCDFVAEIPQYGTKESLNIFSALSVSLYRFFDK